jgi:ribosomal-protein-alanine N-acetyltransferase
MNGQSVLETERLKLRPLAFTDASFIQEAAADRAISDTMISVPHPYQDGEGERYVNRCLAEQKKGKSLTFVLELKKENASCGVIEIREIDREHSQAELSFWLRTHSWGQGYMSEGIQAALQYGFEILRLNRFYAYHMLRNPASGRVLEKNGFRQEGLLRQRVIKWGKHEDVAIWAILRQDWDENSG